MAALREPNTRPPGVYFQRADTPRMAIEATRTDMAAFVGIAERGPLHEATRVDSWHQFQSVYGNDYLPYAYMPDAVRGFFVNGGQTAWIVRVGRRDPSPWLRPSVDLVNDQGLTVLRVRAKHQGLAGGRLAVRVTPLRDGRFHLSVLLDDSELESFRDLIAFRESSLKGESRWALDVINSDADHQLANQNTGSQLITVEAVDEQRFSHTPIVGVLAASAVQARAIQQPARRTALQAQMDWNRTPDSIKELSELFQMTWQDFVGDDSDESPRGLRVLKALDQPSLIAIPDAVWRPDNTPERRMVKREGCARSATFVTLEEPTTLRQTLDENEVRLVQQQMILHCWQLKDRFAVIDAPAAKSPQEIADWSDSLRSQEGQYGALYYPWIACPARLDSVRMLPPSGHLCGIYARVDLSQGVHISPANEVIQEARGVQCTVDRDDHGWLNQLQVNLISATASRGVRVMGARTLVDNDQAFLWRNISVRRLLIMLEESIEQCAHWLVHQPNTLQSRMDLERVIRQFLFQQWRQGRLDGHSPEAAFHVICDETNNPLSTIESARLICDLTVKPPAPSEFITVRIGGQSSTTGDWRLGGEDG